MIDTKALREKVLDLAIRGKLVPQDPNDEPASVLLERIRAEKQQMVKEGKLKPKDIKNDTVIYKADDNLHYEKFQDGTVKHIDFKPDFDIPSNWMWCNLGLLFNHNTGKALNSSNSDGKILTYITTSNVYWDQFELDSLKSMPFTDAEIDKCTVSKGDLLVCEGGDIGRAAIWQFDEKIRIQNHLHRLRAYDNIQTRFYYFVIYLNKMSGKINGNGIGLQGLSSNTLHKILVPVPPVEEQKKIVSAIENVISIIEDIGCSQRGLISHIDTIKSKILDLAIRGKLVPQDPNDEPASVLLERIQAEKEELIKQGKIKRDKKESVIFKGDDNSYYQDLPSGWAECSILEIAEVELGKTLDKAKNTGTLYPYLRSVNIQWNSVDLSDLNTMRFEQNELERYSVKKNDLLVCEGGDVGRCCVWNSEPFLYQNAIHRIRFYEGCNPYFFMYALMYLESIGYLKRISNGVTIKHLTKSVLSKVPLLLPPIAEQHRIVEAIETAFAQLDNIAS